MGFFTDLILRQVVRSGYVTKPAGEANNLTPVEVDDNYLGIIDELNARDIICNIPTWSAGTVNAGESRIYDSKLWLCLVTNTNAPSEGTDWTRINQAQLGHRQNTDTKLDEFGSNEVTAAQIKSVIDNVGNEFSFDVTIPAADVLDIFSTPYELVPAQGANTIIVPTSIQGQMIYGTTPYATDGEIDIYCGGIKQVWGFPADDGFLFGTVSRVVNGFAASSNNVTDTQYVANQPLTIKTVGSNPTAGDSDIRIFGTYKVIDIS